MSTERAEGRTVIQNIFLISVIFLIYVRPYEEVSFLESFQLTRIFVVLALVGCLLNSFYRRYHSESIIRENTVKWFIALQIISVISVFFSIWSSNSLDRILSTNTKIVIVFFILSSLIYSRKQLLLFLNTIYVSVSLFSIRVIVAYQQGQYVIDSETKRIAGIGTLGSDDPNDIALVLSMTVPIGLFFVLKSSGKLKVFYFALLCIIFVALAATGSRGGLLGLVMGVTVFFGLLYRKQKIKFLSVMLVLFISLITFLPGAYKERFMSMLDTSEYSYSDDQYGRINIWRRSVAALMQRPIGYGMGNSIIAEGKQKEREGTSGKWMVVHNTFLQIALELGIIGLFVYLMFLYSSFRNGLFVLRESIENLDKEYVLLSCGLVAGLSAFMISGIFLSQAYYWNTYIFIALILGLKRTTMISTNEKD
ncbi:MAG: hypothetical protein D6B25_11600 [Desulfobulbaceae bacterium]|nr:MAG: hypothetical protein D6B25_11600 [Desulfobulbaceae bacterium]